jgi:hypothetical protein
MLELTKELIYGARRSESCDDEVVRVILIAGVGGEKALDIGEYEDVNASWSDWQNYESCGAVCFEKVEQSSRN